MLLGILIGGAEILRLRNPNLRVRGDDDFFGEVWGEACGLERGVAGTRVSELVAADSVCELMELEVRVSELEPRAPACPPAGTDSVLLHWSGSRPSLELSPVTPLNVMHVTVFPELALVPDPVIMVMDLGPATSSGDVSSESLESVSSFGYSLVSDSVSQDAMGASLGLGGISSVVVWGSPPLEVLL